MHRTTLFALMWPESASLSAREPIAGCLRAIARLLHLGRANNGSQNSSSQREQLELKIASRLSEANSAQVSCLEETSPGVKEIYVACLPWLLEQATMPRTHEAIETKKNREKIISDIDRAMRDSASTMEGLSDRTQSRVLTVLLLAIVAPVHAAIIKETVILLGGRPIANVQIIDSAHTGGRWASTLNNLGVLDPDQGQVEEARKQYAEALQIYRELAQEYPETYRPKVAETLNNLGLLDSNHGRVEEARNEFVEALQIHRELAQKNSATYRPYVARTLNNLGVLDRDQGQVEEARNEYAQALQIYRELAQKNPEAYQPYVGTTLNKLGGFDSDHGRLEEAREEFLEALQIYEALSKQNPERFSRDVERVKKLLADLPN